MASASVLLRCPLAFNSHTSRRSQVCRGHTPQWITASAGCVQKRSSMFFLLCQFFTHSTYEPIQQPGVINVPLVRGWRARRHTHTHKTAYKRDHDEDSSFLKPRTRPETLLSSCWGGDIVGKGEPGPQQALQTSPPLATTMHVKPCKTMTKTMTLLTSSPLDQSNLWTELMA